MKLYEIDLATGQVQLHRADIFPPDQVDACRLVAYEGGRLPDSACRVQVNGPLFLIWRSTDLVSACAAGQGRETLWQVVAGLHENAAPLAVPNPPADHAWLAVSLRAGFANLVPHEQRRVMELQRFLAAALLV